MKKFIVLIAMLLPISVMASIPELDKVVDEFSSTDGVTAVNLSGEMLRAQAAMGGEGANKHIDKLESLVILAAEDPAMAKRVSKRVEKALKSAELNSLADITPDKDTSVKIYANKEGDVLRDIAIYVFSGDEMALIIVSGELDESMIGDLQGGLVNIG